MSRIFLSLGTNLGNRKKNLDLALELLSAKVNILKKSSVYETEPVGLADQPWFLNLVVEGETDLPAEELLLFTQSIEQQLKRVKTIVNGPRIIDVDILLYGEERINTKNLTVPHPRMLQRAFVMVPLMEISPYLELSGRSIKEIMEDFRGEEVHLWSPGMDRVNVLLRNPDYVSHMEKNRQLEINRIYCHHDLQHSLDTSRIAYILALEEKLDVEKEILYAAGLLHDIGRWQEYVSGMDHAAASMGLAEKILRESRFSDGEITEILDAIGGHRENTASAPLSELLYQADKLSRNCSSCQARSTCKRFQQGEKPYLLY